MINPDALAIALKVLHLLVVIHMRPMLQTKPGAPRQDPGCLIVQP